MEIIKAVIVFVLMGICVFLSARQFAEKGYLFNNAYIYASKEERARMDKKPHYRQSAIVFCLLSAVLLVLGVSMIIQNDTVLLLTIPLIVGTLIYAIVSSIVIERNQKDNSKKSPL